MAATSHEERQPDMCHPKKMPPAVKYPCKKKKIKVEFDECSRFKLVIGSCKDRLI